MRLIKNINFKFVVVVAVISTFLLIYLVKFTKEDPLLKEAESFRAKKLSNPLFLQNVETNEDYSNQILRGEVFLIYAISSCGACKKELQFFSQAETDSKPAANVVAVMFEDREVVTDYIKQNNIKIPVLIDKDGKLLQQLNLQYFPANLKLKNGEIKKASFGLPPDANDLLAQAAY